MERRNWLICLLSVSLPDYPLFHCSSNYSLLRLFVPSRLKRLARVICLFKAKKSEVKEVRRGRGGNEFVVPASTLKRLFLSLSFYKVPRAKTFNGLKSSIKLFQGPPNGIPLSFTGFHPTVSHRARKQQSETTRVLSANTGEFRPKRTLRVRRDIHSLIIIYLSGDRSNYTVRRPPCVLDNYSMHILTIRGMVWGPFESSCRRGTYCIANVQHRRGWR